jgi:hypothetical protein
MSLRVAPNSQSSSCAGDGASSRLDSRILQRLCKRSSGLPRLSASPAPPPDEASGRPESCILRPDRRWSFELPRLSHPSAAPGARFRVAPAPHLSSSAYRLRLRVAPSPQPSGLPTVRVFRLPRILSPSGLAFDSTSGSPRLPRLLACLGIRLWVAPNPSPLALPADGSPGCPEFLTLRRCRLRILGSPRLLRLRLCRSTSSGFPESCFCGWADVDSPTQLELCILDARPWMNLRVQSGLAHSHPALDALLISPDPPLPSPAAERHFQFILHRPARLELRFQQRTERRNGSR